MAHGDIVDASYGSGMSFHDPDNIALELVRAALVAGFGLAALVTLSSTNTSAAPVLRP